MVNFWSEVFAKWKGYFVFKQNDTFLGKITWREIILDGFQSTLDVFVNNVFRIGVATEVMFNYM